jgi:hypothetical protein
LEGQRIFILNVGELSVSVLAGALELSMIAACFVSSVNSGSIMLAAPTPDLPIRPPPSRPAAGLAERVARGGHGRLKL